MKIGMTIYKLWLYVIEETHTGYPVCVGEIEVTLDSEETAWVEPCSRLTMTEEVVQAVADILRPMGVKWMRGWKDGRYVGRVIKEDSIEGVANTVNFVGDQYQLEGD
jgi:hypothetical protein